MVTPISEAKIPPAVPAVSLNHTSSLFRSCSNIVHLPPNTANKVIFFFSSVNASRAKALLLMQCILFFFNFTKELDLKKTI